MLLLWDLCAVVVFFFQGNNEMSIQHGSYTKHIYDDRKATARTITHIESRLLFFQLSWEHMVLLWIVLGMLFIMYVWVNGAQLKHVVKRNIDRSQEQRTTKKPVTNYGEA